MIELELFQRRLDEAAAWCARAADASRPFSSLRSRAFEPSTPWFVPRVDEAEAARAYDFAEERFRLARPDEASTFATMGAIEAAAFVEENRGRPFPSVAEWRRSSPWCAKSRAASCSLASRRAPSLHLAVEDVSQRRAELLQSAGSARQSGSAPSGRLLVCHDSFEVKLAEMRTRGFFDHGDLPPWDTWIAYERDEQGRGRDYLLAWIPECFVELADTAVREDLFGALAWAQDEDSVITQRLRCIRPAGREQGPIVSIS
jgi:hypothetical protein